MKSKPIFSSSQTLFTFSLLVFFFTLLNGYLLNLFAGYRANPWLVLAGLVVEMSATLFVVRRRVAIVIDPLEIAGFMLVVVGGWWYFVIPALPTLLPPTQSSDAVRVYLQVLYSFSDGRLVSWYPPGGTFLTAMFANWFGIDPLRLLHPVAASFVALSAGAVYGITCALLPPQRLSKIAALIAPALLFVPWSYFTGALNWEQYFFAQVFAQYFILAATWYIACYVEQTHWLWAVLIGAALLGVVFAYPILVVLPLGLFGLMVLVRIARQKNLRQNRGLLITLGAFIGLLILVAVVLQLSGILEFIAGKIALEGDVGAGGVAKPSLENLGGPIFLALVVIGAWLAWRRPLGKTILGLVVVWAAQLGALLLLQLYLPVSSYRIDKTFYFLALPFAMLAALPLAWLLERICARFKFGVRAFVLGLAAAVVLLGAGVWVWRPPKSFTPLTESEIQVAQWAKKFYNETYQIAYLDDSTISAYWLVFGLWRETLPNEWFQWVLAGRKLGPATFDEWRQDPGWHDRMLVRYLDQVPGKVRVVYQAGDSAIIDKDTPPDYGPKPPHRSDLIFGSTITLIGYDLPRTTFKPGETITLTTWTQSLYPPPATVAWRLELVDHAGNAAHRIERDPFDNKYPLQRWAPGKYSRDTWTIRLDSNLSPGAYALQLAMFRRADGELIDVRPVYTTKPTAPISAAPITRIKIPLASPGADELRAAQSIEAHFGDLFALPNYRLETDRAFRRVQLTLYWQSLKPTEQNYTAFAHLLDASGKIVAQVDAEPRGGTYPTSLWDAGEIVKDEYDLAIPADARAPFTLEIGMYAQPSLERLPVGRTDHLEFRISDF